MRKIDDGFSLEEILEKAETSQVLLKREIEFLFRLEQDDDIQKLFQSAREMRVKYFNKHIFLYGFVYFSSWCKNDCNFCYYRKSNVLPNRYRKTNKEILEAVLRLADSGVHLIDLTMGEDPFYYSKDEGFSSLMDLITESKKQTNLAVMVSPGVVSKEVLRGFKMAGADWYACYQETFNKKLFKQLRVNQNYNNRILSKKQALKIGLLIEEGILLGVGENTEDIADSIIEMGNMGAHQIRVMSFVPQAGIPMAESPTPSRVMELKVIAILRLLYPNRLIPASLDVDGIKGMEARLNAGANVITSLIPPSLGFMGVAQNSKDIDEGFRTVQGVTPVLRRLGLEVATQNQYRQSVHLKEGVYERKKTAHD